MSLGGKRQIDLRVAVHVAFALEVADAAVEEDDLANGQRPSALPGCLAGPWPDECQTMTASIRPDAGQDR